MRIWGDIILPATGIQDPIDLGKKILYGKVLEGINR